MTQESRQEVKGGSPELHLVVRRVAGGGVRGAFKKPRQVVTNMTDPEDIVEEEATICMPMRAETPELRRRPNNGGKAVQSSNSSFKNKKCFFIPHLRPDCHLEGRDEDSAASYTRMVER